MSEDLDALRADVEADPPWTITKEGKVIDELKRQQVTLNKKRPECGPLYDKATTALARLHRMCTAYSVSTVGQSSPATAADTLAVKICHP